MRVKDFDRNAPRNSVKSMAQMLGYWPQRLALVLYMCGDWSGPPEHDSSIARFHGGADGADFARRHWWRFDESLPSFSADAVVGMAAFMLRSGHA